MRKKESSFSAKERLKSFTCAFSGLQTLLHEEHNARLHIVAAVIVIVLGFWLKVSTTEWLILLLTIAIVVVVEVLNSAIENLADAISEDYNLKIKKAKDLGAAAVLLTAVIALIVGGLIFLPKVSVFF